MSLHGRRSRPPHEYSRADCPRTVLMGTRYSPEPSPPRIRAPLHQRLRREAASQPFEARRCRFSHRRAGCVSGSESDCAARRLNPDRSQSAFRTWRWRGARGASPRPRPTIARGCPAGNPQSATRSTTRHATAPGHAAPRPRVRHRNAPPRGGPRSRCRRGRGRSRCTPRNRAAGRAASPGPRRRRE